MYKLKQFFKSLYNVYRWLPIIWKDRDYDYFYIFEVLKFKIKNQINYLKVEGHHQEDKFDIQRMETCLKLIERVQTDYYQDEYGEYLESNTNYLEIEPTNNSGKLDMYFSKYSRSYKIVKSAENLKFSANTKYGIAINIGHINHAKAVRVLFKLLERNIEKWWS